MRITAPLLDIDVFRFFGPGADTPHFNLLNLELLRKQLREVLAEPENRDDGGHSYRIALHENNHWILQRGVPGHGAVYTWPSPINTQHAAECYWPKHAVLAIAAFNAKRIEL